MLVPVQQAIAVACCGHVHSYLTENQSRTVHTVLGPTGAGFCGLAGPGAKSRLGLLRSVAARPPGAREGLLLQGVLGSVPGVPCWDAKTCKDLLVSGKPCAGVGAGITPPVAFMLQNSLCVLSSRKHLRQEWTRLCVTANSIQPENHGYNSEKRIDDAVSCRQVQRKQGTEWS